MYKLRIIAILLIVCSYNTYAQLPDGVIAPNWTMTDINGTSHTLYDYLDQGKSVVIDVSATWCGPCWSYHNTHALKDVYNNYGPSGTNEMMVFFVEGDGNTNLNCLYGSAGCNYSTQGDWVTGTPYPIINSTLINNNYDINYFPTVYLICPDRVIKEVGQMSAVDIYAEAQQCPLLTTNSNDAKVFEIIEPFDDYCAGNVTPVLKIQNYGTSVLSNLDIYSIVDGIPVDTFYWTGNLEMYQTSQITLNQTPTLTDGNHIFEFQTANPNGQVDEDASNDIMSSSFSTNSTGTEVTIKVKTDGNPSQTSWDIQLNGTVVASGGNFQNSNFIYIDYSCLILDSCYTFNVYDSGNNGLDGTSFGLIFWNGGTIASFPASAFNNGQISLEFCLTSTGINILSENEIDIFPNPVKDILHIELKNHANGNTKVIITDIFGRIIKFEDFLNNKSVIEINLSELSDGVYNATVINNDNTITKKFIVID